MVRYEISVYPSEEARARQGPTCLDHRTRRVLAHLAVPRHHAARGHRWHRVQRLEIRVARTRRCQAPRSFQPGSRLRLPGCADRLPAASAAHWDDRCPTFALLLAFALLPAVAVFPTLAIRAAVAGFFAPADAPNRQPCAATPPDAPVTRATRLRPERRHLAIRTKPRSPPSAASPLLGGRWAAEEPRGDRPAAPGPTRPARDHRPARRPALPPATW